MLACELGLLGRESNSAVLFQSSVAVQAADPSFVGHGVSCCCCVTQAYPTLGLVEHKALLLGKVKHANSRLFDQLNAAVDEEHFHLLCAGRLGISNTSTNVQRQTSTSRGPPVYS